MKRNTKAFTLIELLVVMVIIGILAAVGVAQFKNYKHKARIAKALTFEREVHQTLLLDLVEDQKTPVLMLDFNEGSGTKVNDASGNGYSYTINSNQWTTDTPDGSGSAISAHYSSGFTQESINEPATKAITLSVWVKPVVINPSRGIQPVIIFYTGQGPNEVKLYESSVKWHFVWNSDYVEVDASPIMGEWNHLLATYDGTTVRIYLNRELILEESKTLTNDIFSGTNNIAIGDSKSYDTIQEYYIDRLRLYPSAYIPE